MSRAPDDLNKAVLDTLVRCEPELLDGEDEALKRATFVLAHLLGALLAIVREKYGDVAAENITALAKRRVDKSACELGGGDVTTVRLQ